MWLEVKGAMKIKTKNLPVIFLSNTHLLENFKAKKAGESGGADKATLDALADRFTIVEVTQQAKLFDPSLL